MKKQTSLKWKLCKYLMLFGFGILAIIAVFQNMLLEPMYEESKIEAIKEVEKNVEKGLQADDFNSFITGIQTQSDTCIAVYQASGSTIAQSGNSSGCVLYSLSEKKITSYINKALESEDHSHLAKIDMVPVSLLTGREGSTFRTMIYTKIVDAAQSSAVIMVAASITPLDATISTLTNQLYLIMIFLIVAIIGLTILLYKKIVNPLIAINTNAKMLDTGVYHPIERDDTYAEAVELDSTLARAAENIHKADKAQRDLISNVSHDMRTPLTMISGYGEMMIDLPEEKTDENLQVIVDEAKRLNNLVNDLLDLSRLQDNRIELKKETFDIHAFIIEQMKKYEVYRVQDGYQFDVHLDENAYVYADRIRIAQVFNNFVINAINYGGEAKHILITQTNSENTVTISITDFGPGIAPQDIDNIWDRYYKVDQQHVRSSSGSGIGLAICRQMLELHGAKYGVKSKVDEGSTFWFSFEIVKPHTPESE